MITGFGLFDMGASSAPVTVVYERIFGTVSAPEAPRAAALGVSLAGDVMAAPGFETNTKPVLRMTKGANGFVITDREPEMKLLLS